MGLEDKSSPRILHWRDVIEMDFPPMRITEESRQATIEAAQSGRYSPVDTRVALGLFYTDEEVQAMMQMEVHDLNNRTINEIRFPRTYKFFRGLMDCVGVAYN